MKVLGIFMGRSRDLIGCDIYRITMPFAYLEKHGWKTHWIFWEDLMLQMLRANQLNVAGWLTLINQYDLFVLPRFFLPDDHPEFHEGLLNFVKAIKAAGKKVVYEVDDDYTNHFRTVINGDATAVISQANAVTTTTSILAETMAGDRPSYVLPNMVSPAAFGGKLRGTFRHEGKLIIGLTGSTTHYHDWKVLADVIPQLQKYPDVQVIIGGFHPDYFGDQPNVSYLAGLPYESYCQFLKRCDIILAPVDPSDGFNLGKSPLKVLEGMAASRNIPHPVGAATIATNNPVYQLAITDGENGLLVDHTADGWLHAITRLIEDESFRHQIQLNGHRWVWKHHDISKKWSLWANAYKAIALHH